MSESYVKSKNGEIDGVAIDFEFKQGSPGLHSRKVDYLPDGTLLS